MSVNRMHVSTSRRLITNHSLVHSPPLSPLILSRTILPHTTTVSTFPVIYKSFTTSNIKDLAVGKLKQIESKINTIQKEIREQKSESPANDPYRSSIGFQFQNDGHDKCKIEQLKLQESVAVKDEVIEKLQRNLSEEQLHQENQQLGEQVSKLKDNLKKQSEQHRNLKESYFEAEHFKSEIQTQLEEENKKLQFELKRAIAKYERVQNVQGKNERDFEVLQSDNQMLRDEVERLSGILEEKMQSLKEEKEKVSVLSRQANQEKKNEDIRKLREQVEKKQKEFEQLHEHLLGVESEKGRLEEEVEKQKEKIQFELKDNSLGNITKTRELEKKDTQIQNLNAKVATLKSENEQLHAKLQEQELTSGNLAAQVKTLETKVNLQDQEKQVTQQQTEQKGQLIQDLNQQIQQFQSSNHEQQQAMLKLGAQIKEYQAQLMEKQALEDELSKKTTAINDFKKQLLEHQELADKSKDHQASLQYQIQQLDADKLKLQQKVDKLQADVDKLEAASEKLETEVEQHKRDYKKREGEFEKEKYELQQLAENYLEGQRELERKIDLFKQESTIRLSESCVQKNELYKLREQLKLQEIANNEKLNQFKATQDDQVKQLESALQQMEYKCKEVIYENDQKEQDILSLTQRNAKLKETIEQNQHHMMLHSQREEQLTFQFQSEKAKIVQLRQELEEQNRQYKQQIDYLSVELASQNQQSQKLEETILQAGKQEFQSLFEQQEMQINNLQSQNDELQQFCDGIKESLQELQQKYNQLELISNRKESENEKIKHEHMILLEKYEQAIYDIEELSNLKMQLESNLNQTQLEKIRQQNEFAKLEGEQLKTKSQFYDTSRTSFLREDSKQYEQEIQRLMQVISNLSRELELYKQEQNNLESTSSHLYCQDKSILNVSKEELERFREGLRNQWKGLGENMTKVKKR